MTYFLLSQHKSVVNPIIAIGLDSKAYTYKLDREKFMKLEDLKIVYFSNNKYIEICDILQTPAFLISDSIKRLFALYDSHILFKGIQFFSQDETERIAPLYWATYIERVNCLHPSTRKYDTGLVEHLVLDKTLVGGKDIFRIGGLIEDKVAVSLSIAESLLRRGLYGIGLERIEVR